MDCEIEGPNEDQPRVLLNLDQIKQEADEEPHIVYDGREQWAFLFNEDRLLKKSLEPLACAIPSVYLQSNEYNFPITECDNELNSGSALITQNEVNTEIKTEPAHCEEAFHTCHWCSFNTNDPLDLIDHDFERHARYHQGKRIHKSYKCPSCEYTSVDPYIIRCHFEMHRNPADDTAASASIISGGQKKKKRKKKPLWYPQVKKGREQKRLVKPDETKIRQDSEDVDKGHLKMILDGRNLTKKLNSQRYRASLAPDELENRRLTLAAKMRLKRSQETVEQRAERRRKQALLTRLKRAKETPEQIELRRTKQRNRARLKRSLETDEQRELRKEKERMRARERRATMPTDKKELVKEKERIRKRRIRQQAKVAKRSHFMFAADFLATSMSPSENSYQQTPTVVYETNSSNNLDDVMKLYPLPLYMLNDQSELHNDKKTIKSSNPKNQTKNKRKPRPRVDKNKANLQNIPTALGKTDFQRGSFFETIDGEQIDVPSQNISEPKTIIYQGSFTESFNGEHGESLSNITYVQHCDSPAEKLLTPLSTCGANAHQTIEEIGAIKFNGFTQKESFSQRKHELEGFKYKTESDIPEYQAPFTELYRTCTSNEIQEGYSNINAIKPNQINKNDKINKLLERMHSRGIK